MKDWLIQFAVNRLGASWRTGALGLMLVLAGVSKAGVALFDSEEATKFSWEETSTAVLAGWALMLARDNKVSSEAVAASREDRGTVSNSSSDKPVV